MSSKVGKLVGAYKQHLAVPWQEGIAGIQRIIFAVYDKTDELRLQIISGKSEEEIRNSWKKDLEQFEKIRTKYLIYEN